MRYLFSVSEVQALSRCFTFVQLLTSFSFFSLWPPNSQREIEEQICRQILARCKSNRVVVVGAFNLPYIDWDSFSARGMDGAEFVRNI